MKFKDTRVIVPDHVMAREVGDELVILNLDNEQYYGLDESGAHMWIVLTSTPSVKSAVEHLHTAYDVALETLENDLENLINNLVKEGLLEVATL